RSGPFVAVVHPDRDDDDHRRAQRALAEEAARNIERDEELPSEESIGGATSTGDWQISTMTGGEDLAQERTTQSAAQPDRGSEPTRLSSATAPTATSRSRSTRGGCAAWCAT